MSISLYEAFEEFCGATNGKLKWGDDRSTWTTFILEFFDDYMRSKGFAVAQKNYMDIDAVWRDPHLRYIVLALEHENEGRVRNFLQEEIHHLLDVKGQNKIGITYPHVGEEKELVDAIQSAVQQASITASPAFGDNYLIILGFDTRQAGKRVIQWKGWFISARGEMEEREKVVAQRSDGA